MKLNEREQFILIEALESWEAEPIRSSIAGSMMGSLLKAAVNDEDGRATKILNDDMAKTKVEAEAKQIIRKREAILLKAKILTANNE